MVKLTETVKLLTDYKLLVLSKRHFQYCSSHRQHCFKPPSNLKLHEKSNNLEIMNWKLVKSKWFRGNFEYFIHIIHSCISVSEREIRYLLKNKKTFGYLLTFLLLWITEPILLSVFQAKVLFSLTFSEIICRLRETAGNINFVDKSLRKTSVETVWQVLISQILSVKQIWFKNTLKVSESIIRLQRTLLASKGTSITLRTF